MDHMNFAAPTLVGKLMHKKEQTSEQPVSTACLELDSTVSSRSGYKSSSYKKRALEAFSK